ERRAAAAAADMDSAMRFIASPMVAGVGLISLALAFLAAQGISAPLVLVLGCVVVFTYVVLASGRLALRFAKQAELGIVAAWPLGVTVSGIALWALAATLGLPAAAAFAIW